MLSSQLKLSNLFDDSQLSGWLPAGTGTCLRNGAIALADDERTVRLLLLASMCPRVANLVRDNELYQVATVDHCQNRLSRISYSQAQRTKN